MRSLAFRLWRRGQALMQQARGLVLDARFFLWTACGVKLPALPNWEQRVRETVRNGGVYVGDGVIGAPLQWSLLQLTPEGQLVPVETFCAVTGVVITPTAHVDRDGVRDFSAFGVRCARCGVPLHCKAAGMVTTLSIPSCRPCRTAVQRVERDA